MKKLEPPLDLEASYEDVRFYPAFIHGGIKKLTCGLLLNLSGRIGSSSIAGDQGVCRVDGRGGPKVYLHQVHQTANRTAICSFFVPFSSLLRSLCSRPLLTHRRSFESNSKTKRPAPESRLEKTKTAGRGESTRIGTDRPDGPLRRATGQETPRWTTLTDRPRLPLSRQVPTRRRTGCPLEGIGIGNLMSELQRFLFFSLKNESRGFETDGEFFLVDFE